jgi:hypothetical protein
METLEASALHPVTQVDHIFIEKTQAEHILQRMELLEVDGRSNLEKMQTSM